MLTGTNWAADATKASVVHAARGETALCVLLCNKRKVGRLSEQGQDWGVPLAFLSSTGVTACAQVLLSGQRVNSKNWSRGAAGATCIQSGSKILLLKCHARARLGTCLLQFLVQFVSDEWTVIIPLTVVSGDLQPPLRLQGQVRNLGTGSLRRLIALLLKLVYVGAP